MAGFVLFIPKVTGANPQHVARVGLGELLADGAPEFADCTGPENARGVVCGWRTGNADSDPALSPVGLTWTPAKADKRRGLKAKRFWIGVDPSRPLRPEDIERKTQYDGYAVKLADGNLWHIPAAVNLPHKAGLNDDGEFCRVIANRWRPFYEASQRHAAIILAACGELLTTAKPKGKFIPVTIAESFAFCCDALAINYRLTPELVDAFGLLDDPSQSNVVKAAVNLPCLLGKGDAETNVLRMKVNV
jgi:hypothetical protein